ncbi:hypothetical protein [Pelagicoccus sp. SDUM812003]|uniref:hypothetical protein n=1 Tax=Pelagicoccus sp. SDUM812003 TaxID=3041267 RepID=UPI00280E7173|nr:hypothetical protein [Pelagicoccus sp. SDUM812003]MDQ8203745.1 hypothetical protein [Pelagicoccus sp. SDUM812003]
MIATTVITLFESPPDGGLFLVTLFTLVMAFRYSLRIARSSIRGESCVSDVAKLSVLGLFCGFCAVGRMGLVFVSWARSLDVGYHYLPYRYMHFGVYWTFLAVFLSLCCFLFGYLALHAKQIQASRVGRLLIRFRWLLFGGAVAAYAVIMYWISTPRGEDWESALARLETTPGFDAIDEPDEVLLYRVKHVRMDPFDRDNFYPGYETPMDIREKGEDEQIAQRFRRFRFSSYVEKLDPKAAKDGLDDLFVYAADSWASHNATFMLRFVGKHSVVDVWLSEYGEMDIFSSQMLSDIPHILAFSKPYEDLMINGDERSYKFLIEGNRSLGRWSERLDRLEIE